MAAVFALFLLAQKKCEKRAPAADIPTQRRWVSLINFCTTVASTLVLY